MEIDELMTQEEVYSNSVKCQELALEKDANNTELEELYEKWKNSQNNLRVLSISFSNITSSR